MQLGRVRRILFLLFPTYDKESTLVGGVQLVVGLVLRDETHERLGLVLVEELEAGQRLDLLALLHTHGHRGFELQDKSGRQGNAVGQGKIVGQGGGTVAVHGHERGHGHPTGHVTLLHGYGHRLAQVVGRDRGQRAGKQLIRLLVQELVRG